MAALSAILLALIVWWMRKNSTVTYEKVYANDSDDPPVQNFTFNE
jgi:hypothetical protein